MVKPNILCFGDSNTYGYDPRSYLGERYPASVRWTGLLEAAGWRMMNAGENGRSIPRLDWEIEAATQAVRQSEAEALVVMLGSNDLLQRPGLHAEICTERMEQFLTAAMETCPAGVKVLLVAPPPMKPGTWVQDAGLLEESRRLAGCYEALAQRLGICFADAGAWDIDLAFDGVHFSEAGHRAFADGMRKCLESLFS